MHETQGDVLKYKYKSLNNGFSSHVRIPKQHKTYP